MRRFAFRIGVSGSLALGVAASCLLIGGRTSTGLAESHATSGSFRVGGEPARDGCTNPDPSSFGYFSFSASRCDADWQALPTQNARASRGMVTASG